ncbi:cytochrome P450 [Rhizobium vallis]|uniref:Cytochrome P450 n=1 Tax=Rhizobium vallis TaxID=634290 RepID=A0A432PC64_9HYPH|nr:cytochrome P450 [Rhizobium vallis]RUM20459.1 cytochrome P450 [Rhizobium vallis]
MPLVEGHTAVECPKGIPLWDIDPYDEDILRDPHEYYTELRQKGPLVYIPKYSVLASGTFAVTREIFSDWQRFVSSRGVGLTDFGLVEPWRPPSIILEVDPPAHTLTRAVMARALSPKAVMQLKEDFARSAKDLIRRLLDRGAPFDAVVDLAEAFPTDVFPRAVGLRERDARRMTDYGAMVFNALGPDNHLRRDALAKAADIVPWITNQCSREKLLPGGFGEAIYAASDAGEITPEQAGMLVRSLLSAGVDTTVTGIGNALWCLANNPDQYALLREDPSRARAVFEEALRLTSPVHTFCRTAAADTEVAGTKIAEGTKVLCVLGAANTDPDHWDDPMRFDISRKVTGHMAFGAGIHGCVGQNVARAEGEAILSELAKAVRSLELVGAPVWRPNNAIRALDKLPVRFLAA